MAINKSGTVSFKELMKGNAIENDSDEDDYLNVFLQPSSVKKPSELDADIFRSNDTDSSVTRSSGLKSILKSSKSLDDDLMKDQKAKKRTLFSELKGKLSDKFPETYSTISKKIEELTNENVDKSEKSDIKYSSLKCYTSNLQPPGQEAFLNVKEEDDSSIIDLFKDIVNHKGLGDKPNLMEKQNYSSKSPIREGLDIEESIADYDEHFVDYMESNQSNQVSSSERVERVLSKESENSYKSETSSVRKSETSSVRKRFSNNISHSSSTEKLSNSFPHEKSVTKSINTEICSSNCDNKTLSSSINTNLNSVSNTDICLSNNATTKSDESGASTDTERNGNKLFSKAAVKSIAIVMLVVTYFIIPLSSFYHGFLCGLMGVLLIWFLHNLLERKPIEDFNLKPFSQLLPPRTTSIAYPNSEDGVYEGWMNTIKIYNPESFHFSKTKSIYIHLNATVLQLSKPDQNIPRRATCNEKIPPVRFLGHKYIDLKGCRIFLLPENIPESKLWSKKYPICISTNSQCVDGQRSSVSSQKRSEDVIFLFARSSHEKEQWYHRMTSASDGRPLKNHLRELCDVIRDSLSFNQKSNSSFKGSEASDTAAERSTSQDDYEFISKESTSEPYLQYMARLIPTTLSENITPMSDSHKKGKDYKVLKHVGSVVCDSQIVWLNALVGRCFWDFLWTNYWAEKMKQKIQNKISKIHVPHFIEALLVTDIHLGCEIPLIRKISKYYIDGDGFWVEMDITYNGGFCMSVETKLNLMKLKKDSNKEKEMVEISVQPEKKSAVLDEDEEDSAESSSDSDDDPTPSPSFIDDKSLPAEKTPERTSNKKSKKIVQVIDKIASSKYFQQATDMKYIKKALEEVSNTRIMLVVEVKTLVGCFCIKIPPPPSDRIWYGFRGKPRLWLEARPKVGQRSVNINQLTEWIKKKLVKEFHKVFVIPNMDDIYVPVMFSGIDDN